MAKGKFRRFWLKLALPLIKRMARTVLTKRKKAIVAKLNAKVNLPRMTEADEKKLLDALYDVILTVLDGL